MTTAERSQRPTARCGSGSRNAEAGWRSRIREEVVSQFGRPRGALGRLAGAVMAHRRSNIQRSLWTVSLLDPRPGDRLLEIGFGPGVAIAEASRRVAHGVVVGVDHSETMWRRAARVNDAAIRAGRVRLILGSIEERSPAGGPFDGVFTVNSIGFWPRPVAVLRTLAQRLRPGGRIAITEQPRGRGADASTALAAGRRIVRQLQEAGFERPRVKTLPLAPAPAVCVLARPHTSPIAERWDLGSVGEPR